MNIALPITPDNGSTTMAKMLVIYKTPADPAAFDRQYFDIHVPLAKQLPGLQRYEISRRPIVNVLQGEVPYIVATLYFDSLEAIRSAFASEIGRACAVDRRKLAGDDDLAAMLLFDTEPL
ncbi:Ethyl tert-butyl ether degradation EthD [Mesorhizobium sp. LNHC232B00]|nr:Ethyl tert-butyl ether degradation EthD [Mesorhizobium sp. LNHC232B00]